MSRAMNMQEFASLLRTIRDHHSPFFHKPGDKVVKYVDPHIDMRTNDVFSITFRMFGGKDANFNVMNESRELPECLYDRCMNWLRSRE